MCFLPKNALFQEGGANSNHFFELGEQIYEPSYDLRLALPCFKCNECRLQEENDRVGNKIKFIEENDCDHTNTLSSKVKFTFLNFFRK